MKPLLWGERKTDRDRQRARERHIETERVRETDRQIETQTERERIQHLYTSVGHLILMTARTIPTNNKRKLN